LLRLAIFTTVSYLSAGKFAGFFVPIAPAISLERVMQNELLIGVQQIL